MIGDPSGGIIADPSQVCEVHITAPDPTWLADFTRRLVEDRLCASGNMTQIQSVYRWRHQIYDRPEARVALHTRTSLLPAITQRVQTEHPYEVPAIVALPILAGNPSYLRWILDETSPLVP